MTDVSPSRLAFDDELWRTVVLTLTALGSIVTMWTCRGLPSIQARVFGNSGCRMALMRVLGERERAAAAEVGPDAQLGLALNEESSAYTPSTT